MYKYIAGSADSGMSVFKKPPDIFSYICHFIFAVIIATSYEHAAHVFINPEKPFLEDALSVILGLELLLAYTAIVSGWVGYSRSMIKWPHTNTKSGSFRFCLDLGILFCYFGLIASAEPGRGFQDYFLNWIIVLFALFVAWDILKLKEHYKKRRRKMRQALESSLGKTVAFLVVFSVFAPPAFDFIAENQTGVLTEPVTYGITLVLTIALMLLYRYWKWSIIPPQERNVN